MLYELLNGRSGDWYPVALSVDVTTSPRRVTLFEADYVVWRSSSDGSIAAFLDRCPHRGSRLSTGGVIDGQLVCAYHGLGFNTDGIATRLPHWDVDREFENARICPVGAQEKLGLVWLCPTPGVDRPLPCGELAFEEIIYAAEKHIDCSAGVIVENMFDTTHFDVVHTASFAATNAVNPADINFVPLGTSFRMMYDVKITANQAFRETVGPNANGATVEALYLPPTSQLFTVRYNNGIGYSSIQAACPKAPTRCAYFQVGYSLADAHNPPQDCLYVSDMEILEEDIAAMESVLGDPFDKYGVSNTKNAGLNDRHVHHILAVLSETEP